MADLLADTYAFIELFGGNPRYREAFRSSNIATTAMNVVEGYAMLLRRIDPPGVDRCPKSV